jgi:hypothetical protein
MYPAETNGDHHVRTTVEEGITEEIVQKVK